MAPLEPMKSRLLILDGIDMKSAVGEQHQAGIIALLTGTIVFGRTVLLRAAEYRKSVVLSLGVFKAMQIASLLQLIALVSPILPERTHVDRGIDGLAKALERP